MSTGRNSSSRIQPRTRIKFWGVRGSIPTPGPTTVFYGGNTSCIEVRAGDQIIILDAGTGLRGLGRELVSEFDGEPLQITLLLTHTHWDHIQGLPFFLPVYKPENRLRILGYKGARLGLHNILTGQMESPFFPIGLRKVPANVTIKELKEYEFDIGDVRVRACRANHPGNCVGYRLFTRGGSVAFFPDNELREKRGLLLRGTGGKAPMRASVSVEQMAEFLRGTDALIMDTQYDLPEYKIHAGWGHGCLDDVVAMAMKAQVKWLFLFHHDPDHDDTKIKGMISHARKLVKKAGAGLQVEAAREGLTVEL
ncbi:MAG: MBL fold metallo-hydrolase [Verrucomicrobia bacterium]|nr:MAG: MBL fold metallo-hydrolase [Verrucomicrobiota bacterium]